MEGDQSENLEYEENKNQYDYVRDFEWTKDMEEEAIKILTDNSEITLDNSTEIQVKNWEKFYKFNKTNFFKDRHYILREFLELKDDERVFIYN
jgi:hypothetical protein